MLLRRFQLRVGSGGEGLFRGGEGVVREIEFRKQQTVSILSERRSLAPKGLVGGGDGARGQNLASLRDDVTGGMRNVSLGGKNSIDLKPGESITIITPGGGGFGART